MKVRKNFDFSLNDLLKKDMVREMKEAEEAKAQQEQHALVFLAPQMAIWLKAGHSIGRLIEIIEARTKIKFSGATLRSYAKAHGGLADSVKPMKAVRKKLIKEESDSVISTALLENRQPPEDAVPEAPPMGELSQSMTTILARMLPVGVDQEIRRHHVAAYNNDEIRRIETALVRHGLGGDDEEIRLALNYCEKLRLWKSDRYQIPLSFGDVATLRADYLAHMETI
jgi:hypothetical protein